MTYGGKSPATGYTAFNKTDSNNDNALQNSNDSANQDDNSVVAMRKKALKKRLLSMKGN